MALPAALVVTAGWAVSLLNRTPTFHTWLRPALVAGVALASAGIWLAWHFRNRALLLGAGAVAAATVLAGPGAFAMAPLTNASTGSIVAAGPGGGGGFGGAGRGGGGGPGGQGQASTALISYLEANRGDATYLVAAFGSGSSAPIIIASGKPVVTIGGFTGSDPAPTVAQLAAMVKAGELKYVLISDGGFGGGGGPGGGGSSSSISAWVKAHGKAVTGVSTSGGTLYAVSAS
jgi:hypothetical protein